MEKNGDSSASNNPLVGFCIRKLNMACHDGEYIPVGHEGRPACTGRMSGRKVSVLRDTVCDTLKEPAWLRNISSQEIVNCLLIDGTKRMFGLAKVRVDTSYLNGEITVLYMKNPIGLHDVIIGNLPDARDPNNPDKNWFQSNDDTGMNVDTGGQMTKSVACNTEAVETIGA